jgi:hypothetical protein
MKNFWLFLIMLTALYISCTSSEKARRAHDLQEDALFNKWLNHSKSELITKWGVPDSTVTDGKGGEILIYKEGVDYKSVMNEKYTGPQYSFRKQMFINSDSIIYYWKAWRRK